MFPSAADRVRSLNPVAFILEALPAGGAGRRRRRSRPKGSSQVESVNTKLRPLTRIGFIPLARGPRFPGHARPRRSASARASTAGRASSIPRWTMVPVSGSEPNSTLSMTARMMATPLPRGESTSGMTPASAVASKPIPVFLTLMERGAVARRSAAAVSSGAARSGSGPDVPQSALGRAGRVPIGPTQTGTAGCPPLPGRA